MSKLVAATQQESERSIFGSGFDTYSWWRKLSREWAYDERGEAPDRWVWFVTVEDPHEQGNRTVMVTHSVLMGAIRRISDGRVVKYVEAETRQSCRDFIFNRDSADFDDASADQLMQVACFGEVVFC